VGERRERAEAGGSVGTLARGLDILALFATHSPELTQKQIAELLGLPLPTVHRLTKLLVERGWLARDPGTRRLSLGLELARLVPALLAGLGLPDVARERLRELADSTGETVNLAVLDRGQVLYLVSESGANLLTLRAGVGLRLPAHCTALGKCLLAQLPEDEARRAAGPEPYPALTERTLTSWRALARELAKVRARGAATSRDEYELGLHSIAVPLAWIGGSRSAAINVSLPGARAGGPAREELTARLHATAAAIEAAAGLRGRAPEVATA
jgi:IclR family acetate operon transcriptional repressor